MSTAKDRRWYFAEMMIREYPELAKALGNKRAVAMTAKYTGMPGGGEPGRSTERVALRELQFDKQLEYDAVRRALELTATLPYGAQRLRLVRMVFWDESHTLAGAACKIGVSYRTAIRWKGELVRQVIDSYWGYLEEKLAPHGQNNVL